MTSQLRFKPVSGLETGPESGEAGPGVPEGTGLLRGLAYERIEALLNAGKLQPSRFFTQRELVELTGSTLGAVREAVQRLEAEGLLVPVARKGLLVPSLDVSFVRDAYQVRKMIELAAVPAMISKLGDAIVADWTDWHQSAATEVSGNRKGDLLLLESLQRRDWELHARFVAAMGNELMNNIYRVNAIKIRMAAQTHLRVTDANALRVISEHLKILESLRARDADATQTALARHIDNSLTLALGGQVG